MVTITCGEVADNQHRHECLCYGLVLAASATAAAVGWTASAVAAASTTTALAHRPSFVHYQRPAQKILAVAGLDGAVGFFVISKFREPESSRLTRELIANDLD
jgi:hypothetical protein